jgi:phospholipase C
MRHFPALLAALALIGCTPQKASWGLDAVATMKTPADDPTLGCGVELPADPAFDARQACTFHAGDRTPLTLGLDRATTSRIPIRHVIVMMKENRSFDHLLGKLHDQGQPGVEAVPNTWFNFDLDGNPVAPFHPTTACIDTDPPHQSQAMIAGVNGGKMDGFVASAAKGTGTDGHFVMSAYEQSDLPFYYWLASTFAINQRHFAPVVSGTFANRNFFYLGKNAGAVDTGIVYPSPDTTTLMHLLMNAGFTWAAYNDDDLPFSGTLNMTHEDPGIHKVQDLYDALDNGTLPNVAFVDARDSIDDDHPTADLQFGEAWSKRIYDHAIKSPQWKQTAIIWTYDEGGGFADHVPPPAGCLATPDSPFTARGPRIPLVVISPWAKRGYASNTVEDHTAITRFISTVFDLPALSGRDANSSALLELFDFSCGRDLSIPAAPAPGTGKCSKMSAP